MISRRELRRNKLHIQKPFIPKSIRRGEDYTGSNLSTLPQTVSTERALEERIRNKTKKLISNAHLTFDQSKILQQKIQTMLNRFNSNKIKSLEQTYNPSNLTTLFRRRLQIKEALSTYPEFSRNKIQSQLRERLFTPESKVRAGFSPQPWRVFSSNDKKIVSRKDGEQRLRNNTGQRTRFKHSDNNSRLMRNCRNLIYDEKTNSDLIYFPFTLHDKIKQKFSTINSKITKKDESNSDILSNSSENNECIENDSKIKTKDIFSSAKKIKSKESRVSLRYGYDNSANDIEKALKVTNDPQNNPKIIQKTENKTNHKDGKSENKIVGDLNNNEQLNLITNHAQHKK